MATKYISQCFIKKGGDKIQHLKNFKKLEEEFRAEIDLMNGSGAVEKARKYKFSLDYAVPKANPKLDWSDVTDATFTIELDGTGKTINYSGVDCLSQGELTFDGEQEGVMTLTFIATGKTIT